MNRDLRILSIDGGGIRGYIAALTLNAIESKLPKDMNLKSAFHLIGGTSTGGIIASAIAAPNDSAGPVSPKILRFYREKGPEIFKKSKFPLLQNIRSFIRPKYPATVINQVFQEYFAEHKIAEAEPQLMLTSYNLRKSEPFFFTSAKAKPEYNINEDHHKYDFYFKDVARAGSAAPSYFPPHRVSLAGESYCFCDGLLAAPNPAVCAYIEAFKTFNPNDYDRIVIVSIGTGEKENRQKCSKTSRWGKIQWSMPVINYLRLGSNQTVDHQLSILKNFNSDHIEYYRLQADLLPCIGELDDAEPKNMRAMESFARTKIIEEQSETIDKIVNALKRKKAEIQIQLSEKS